MFINFNANSLPHETATCLLDFQSECYQKYGSSINNSHLYRLYGDQPEYQIWLRPHPGGSVKPQILAQLIGIRQTPRLELQHNNAPLHFRIRLAAPERRFLIPLWKRRQKPRLQLQNHNTPRHPRTRLARKRRLLIPLRANQFGNLVLNTSLLDQRDEESGVFRASDALLERLDEIADFDAFFGDGSLDFF